MNKKDIRELIDAAKKWQGWRVEESKKGWILYPPDRTIPGVTIHRTPSDWRAWQNMLGRLRRAGAPV